MTLGFEVFLLIIIIIIIIILLLLLLLLLLYYSGYRKRTVAKNRLTKVYKVLKKL